MPKPSDKSQAIEDFIDSLNPSGRKRKESIEKNICTWCGSKVNYPDEFKNPVTQKEYTISGFCQNCQDNTFDK